MVRLPIEHAFAFDYILSVIFCCKWSFSAKLLCSMMLIAYN